MIIDIGYWVVLFWAIIGIIALIIEINTVDLVSIWFVIGAFITMIFSLILPKQQIWQIVIFIIMSTISLALLRPLAKKKIFKNDKDVDTNSMIGIKGEAISDIDKENGHVIINGTSWSAISDKPIKNGSKIIITNQNNLILTVKEIIKEGE